MKKILLMGLVLGLTVAWAVPAMAVDWSASGWIGVGGTVFRNSTLWDPDVLTDLSETGAYMAMRGRLKLTARASEDLFGVMYFEMDSSTFGEAPDGRNHIGAWGADRAAVEVKHLYLDFRIPPGLPLWVRAGVQGFATRGIVFDNDGAGVSLRFSQAFDSVQMDLNAFYSKLYQESAWESSDDSELYGGQFSVGFAPATVGMYFLYQNQRDEAQIPGNMDSEKLWWLGGFADLKFNIITAELDFAYQDGTADADTGFTDIDYGSWLMRGVVAALLMDKLEVGVGGMYVQGEDHSDADETQAFVSPGPGGASYDNADSLVVLGGWMDTDPSGTMSMNLLGGGALTYPGMWYIRVFGMFQVLDWLKVGGQVAYFGDTEKDGDWFTGADAAADDSDIGWELDFGVNIDIYKNLMFAGGFGYLIAQDALNTPSTYAADPDEDISDPWLLVGVLKYTF